MELRDEVSSWLLSLLGAVTVDAWVSFVHDGGGSVWGVKGLLGALRLLEERRRKHGAGGGQGCGFRRDLSGGSSGEGPPTEITATLTGPRVSVTSSVPPSTPRGGCPAVPILG